MATFTFTSEKSSEDAQNSNGGSSLPPGYYRARIMNCYTGTAKSGNTMLVAELDVRGSNDASLLKLYHYMPVSVTWKLEQFAAACGLTFGANQPVSFDPREMVGRFVTVRTCMEADPQNDRLYTRADSLLAPGKEPHLGAMNVEELFAVGLNPDGTRPAKGNKPAPARTPERAPIRTNSYTPGKRYTNPQSQAAIDDKADDNIPF